MLNENFLWTADEYQAIIDYISNGFNGVNVLLSKGITKRELEQEAKYLPKTIKEFQDNIKTVVDLYKAIRKNYILNGSKSYSQKIFRGDRSGKESTHFLSTSDSIRQALRFTQRRQKSGEGLLLIIESENVPYLNVNEFFTMDAVGDEKEILFIPCEFKNAQEIDFTECAEIAKMQGENISNLRNAFKNSKFRKVKLSEVDYSKEKTELSEEDLSKMFLEYQGNLNIIRTTSRDSEEYKKAVQEILKFKESCCTWIHQKFYEINQNIDNQMNIENDGIQVSAEYNMESISIGNTGDMYLVQDKTNNEEYYFKPAISKNGTDRPYRAHIQEAGYMIQRIINPENAVKCNATELNGMFGAIQQKIPIDSQATKNFIEYFNKGKGSLSPEMITQIMDEYLVDFCLCNYDAHANNFIVDEDGKLRGIDKEQSFRYIKEDTDNDMTFSTNYNKRYGEQPTIYNILFEEMKQGKISYEYMKILKYRASRLAQIPNEQYRQIFEKYAYGKAKTPEEAQQLLDSILSRKNNIMQNVELLCGKIRNEASINKTIQNPLLCSGVQATEEQTRTGEINTEASKVKRLSLQRESQDVEKTE